LLRIAEIGALGHDWRRAERRRPVAAANEQPFEFGEWRVEPALGLLTAKDGRSQRLEPKLMDLLVLFAGSNGRVLSKDEIIAAVWDGRVIGDDTLAAAISRLRRVLGGRPGPRYIETTPKRGYRSALAVGTPLTASATRAQEPREAAELASLGRRALASPSPSGFAQARRYFEAAVRAAPDWAPAHAGLAEAMIGQHFAGLGDGLIPAARAAAHAAVGLDPGSAFAWSTLGLATLLADRDFAGADEALRRAETLDPSMTAARRNRAFALATVGRLVDAEREIRTAVALQPLSLENRPLLLQILILARRYGHAAAEAADMLARAPELSEAWYARGWALSLMGRTQAGVAALLRGLELWGADAGSLAALRATFESSGFAALCLAAGDLFAQQQVLFGRRSFDVALLRAMGGDASGAFAALEASLRRDDPVLLLAPWLPYLDSLRADPRYADLLTRVRPVR
jgi:DNA-binding winged helix-turn-helix (wHTH) protein